MNADNESNLVVLDADDSQTVACIFCNKDVPRSAIKCKHCGNDLDPLDEQAPGVVVIDNPMEEDSVEYEGSPVMFRSHPFRFVFCLLLCFVGIGFFIFIFWWVKVKRCKLIVSKCKTSLQTGFFPIKVSEVFHTDIRNVEVDQSLLQRVFNTGVIKISYDNQEGLDMVIPEMPNPYDIKGIIDLHRSPKKSDGPILKL